MNEMTSEESMASSATIWHPRCTSGRNLFVSFVRAFTLDRSPSSAVLCLFADTRYRLWVNGEWLGYGPARFVPQYPEYDQYELAPWLKAGDNTIRVEVNHYGCSSFQSMPDGKPGFRAWGGVEGSDLSFATPGEWKALWHQAWDGDAPHFSFAQNPAEILDLNRLQEELESGKYDTPCVLEDASQNPWGELRPRSVGYPEYPRHEASRLRLCGPVNHSWQRWGLQSHDRRDLSKAEKRERPLKRAFGCWLHSETEQAVTLECQWTDLFVNGVEVDLQARSGLGNYEYGVVDLKEGWNHVMGEFVVLTSHWSFLFGIPEENGTKLSATRDVESACPWVVSPETEFSGSLLDGVGPSDSAWPTDWAADSGDRLRVTPARLMAWEWVDEADRMNGSGNRDGSALFPSRQEGHVVTWCLQFDDLYYGHPSVEIEAPAGSVLDIAYDDWSHEDGRVKLYNSNPFVDAADRFILQGGRERVEVVNPRGGYFMQLTLRLPTRSEMADSVERDVEYVSTLHDVVVRSRRLLKDAPERFRCGDECFEWAHHTGLHTLVTSTDEAYSDSPWRERGTYIGDSYVNLQLHRLITSDFSIARRCIRLFAQAQLPNGQLPPVAPSWHLHPHEDFSLIWILLLREYCQYSGEMELAKEQWHTLENILQSTSWKTHSLTAPLWDAEDRGLFIDWGCLKEERKGTANAALNLFRVGALEAAEELAGKLKLEDTAKVFATERQNVIEALQTHLWDADQGRFLASHHASTQALHANILALRFGVGDRQRILEYLRPLLKNNFDQGIQDGQHSGHAELYFLNYLLPSLAEMAEHALAEELVRQHYGYLKTLGKATLQECFCRANKGVGSCCHSWSGAGAVYAQHYMLGIRQQEEGAGRRWLLDPRTTLQQASGTQPCPGGALKVRWEKQGEKISAQVQKPDDVHVEAGEGVEIELG